MWVTAAVLSFTHDAWKRRNESKYPFSSNGVGPQTPVLSGGHWISCCSSEPWDDSVSRRVLDHPSSTKMELEEPGTAETQDRRGTASVCVSLSTPSMPSQGRREREQVRVSGRPASTQFLKEGTGSPSGLLCACDSGSQEWLDSVL